MQKKSSKKYTRRGGYTKFEENPQTKYLNEYDRKVNKNSFKSLFRNQGKRK